MNAFRSPRLWLIVWAGLGAVLIVYVIIASSVQTSPRKTPSAHARSAALVTGEMADFQYALKPVPAPEIAFLHEGEEITLADFRGKAVLVNFWATWCAPCVKELPSLDALQEKLGGPDFEVVAIAADAQGPEKAGEFLGRHQIEHLRLYADPRLQLIMAVSNATVLPMSILYDRDGREVGRMFGEADWASPEARRLIKSVITENP